MAYTLSERASGASDLTAKNRVWDFFGERTGTRPGNRPRTQQPRRKIRPTPTKTASGIPYWPSRDPIGERGGINLYGFVGNDGVNLWDVLGLCTIGEKRMMMVAGWYLSTNSIEDNEKADQMFALAGALLAGTSIPGAIPSNSTWVQSSLDMVDTVAEIAVAAPGILPQMPSEADGVATIVKYRNYLKDTLNLFDSFASVPLRIIIRWDECECQYLISSGWTTKRHTYTSVKRYKRSTITDVQLNAEIQKAFDEADKL